MRDCANCFHRKPVLKEDGTWTAECEKWDCEFQSRENMIEKTKAMNNDSISREYMKKAIEQFFVREKYYHPHSKGRKTIPTEEVLDLIDNAPTVEDSYNKGYSDAVQGIADEMVRRNQHIEDNRPKGDKDEYNCFHCKYASKPAYEEPCNKCKHSYDNKFEWDMRGEN